MQADRASSIVRLHSDDVLERYLLTAHPISRPIGQHSGWKASVTDQAHVCTAIAKPGNGVFVHKHLATLVEIAIFVIGAR